MVEDRIEKEKARRKAEQEAEELKSAIKVSEDLLCSSHILIEEITIRNEICIQLNTQLNAQKFRRARVVYSHLITC